MNYRKFAARVLSDYREIVDFSFVVPLPLPGTREQCSLNYYTIGTACLSYCTIMMNDDKEAKFKTNLLLREEKKKLLIEIQK